MTERTRDILLLLAGLSGVAAFFLPVQEFFGPITPLGFLSDELAYGDLLSALKEFHGAEWVATLPFLVVAVQASRLRRKAGGREGWLAAPLGFALLLQCGFLALVARAITSGEAGPFSAVNEYTQLYLPLGLSAVNLFLLYDNVRRRRGLLAATEVLLLGTYVAIASFWLQFLGVGGEHTLQAMTFIGLDLMGLACLVYVFTIIVRVCQERTGGRH
jgi:hypothetical protein